MDGKTYANQERGKEECDPATFAELLVECDDKDSAAEHKTDDVDGDVLFPVLVNGPVFVEEPRHTELGDREGNEDVNGVHGDQKND